MVKLPKRLIPKSKKSFKYLRIEFFGSQKRKRPGLFNYFLKEEK
jgi:hypothetical protein